MPLLQALTTLVWFHYGMPGWNSLWFLLLLTTKWQQKAVKVATMAATPVLYLGRACSVVPHIHKGCPDTHVGSSTQCTYISCLIKNAFLHVLSIWDMFKNSCRSYRPHSVLLDSCVWWCVAEDSRMNHRCASGHARMMWTYSSCRASVGYDVRCETRLVSTSCKYLNLLGWQVLKCCSLFLDFKGSKCMSSKYEEVLVNDCIGMSWRNSVSFSVPGTPLLLAVIQNGWRERSWCSCA